MKNLLKTLTFGGVFMALSMPAYAQLDEIIGTASKRTIKNSPGVFMEKKGDFLLLEVSIENDSREFSTRLSEISDTVDNFITSAKSDSTIALSLIDDSDLVRPLSRDTFRTGIRKGSRPDTSVAFLKVKTQIPETVADSYKLATKLSSFVDAIEEMGRTKVSTTDEISVSVVNPYQYRGDVIKLVIAEINNVTSGLGPDYRVIIKGLDKELKWSRSGDLNLAFYLPYTYDVVPTSIKEISKVVYE